MVQTNRGRGDTVLDIDPARDSDSDAADHPFRIDKVENVVADLVGFGVGRIVVGVRVVVAVVQDSGVCVFRCDVQPEFHYQGAAYLRGESLERFLILLEGPVDVQMIGVHGCDRGDRGMKLEERTVEFIGLRHDCRCVACQKIGSVVFGDASEECGTAFPAFGQYVCHEGACGGLPMRPGHGKACLPFGQLTKHPGSLDKRVAVLLDINKFFQICGNSRSVDDQSRGHIFWNVVRIVVVMHVNPFFLKFVSQIGRCPVVACDGIPFEFVVPCDGAHSDATDTYEINL